MIDTEMRVPLGSICCRQPEAPRVKTIDKHRLRAQYQFKIKNYCISSLGCLQLHV